MGPDLRTVDDVLEHFGVKGMKWGVHRTAAEIHSAPHQTEDAQRHAESHAKLKAHGTSALTTQELQAYVQRMNLERQLVTVHQSSTGAKVAKAGGKYVGEILLNVGKQQATKLLNEAVNQQLAKAKK